MANYPDWVKQFREKGTSVKKVGNSYYLYKHTSKRVPGKKYPQAMDTYIGIITPSGVIRKNKKKVSMENIEVREYGFSRALYALCPGKWKTPLGDDWENVLLKIISRHSPNSYLLRDCEPDAGRRNVSLQEEKLKQMLPCTLEELKELSLIFILYFEDREVVSRVLEHQRILLDSLGIELEAE